MTLVYDVLISGGGAVGLSLAVALRRTFGPQFSLAVYDPSFGVREPSVRTSALAAGSRNLLQAIGAWKRLEDDVQPIHTMRVSDSRRGDAVRPVLLVLDEPLERGDPFAYMVHNRALVSALEDEAQAAGIEMIPAAVTRLAEKLGHIEVLTSAGDLQRAKLLVGSDGVQSRVRRLCGIDTVGRDYGRLGIVATVGHEEDHHGIAVQHFLPSGPFAMLPLSGRRSSIVWTEPSADARSYLAMDDDDFVAEVERRFGHSLGRLRLLDGPAAFPLRLHLARRFVGARVALVGDAAHVTHPLAGQGMNLGLRDVAALVSALSRPVRLGLDPGSTSVLDDYQRARFFDTASMLAATDALHRLFSNDVGPLRLLRDLGLSVVNRLPGLKRTFIREAAGVRGEAPPLLRGYLP